MAIKIGCKDSSYYYKSTNEISISFVMKREVDSKALAKAFPEVLKSFPNFAKRPVIKKKTLHYIDNDKPVVILDSKNEKPMYFGSDDTNGYLFFANCYDNIIRLNFFHGLADASGLTPFAMSLIFTYLRECGVPFPDILKPPIKISDEEMYDPNKFYSNLDAQPTWFYDNEEEVFVPSYDGEHTDYLQSYDIHISTKQFIAFTKENATSFLPAMSMIISEAFNDLYNAKDKTIVCLTTFDMRKIFNSKTLTNFSGVAFLPLTSDDRQKSVKEQCCLTRAHLDKQLEKENVEYQLNLNVAQSEYKNKHLLSPYLRVKKPTFPKFTFLLTYPGRLDIPEGCDQFVDSVNVAPNIEKMGDGISLVAKTTGDDMLISVGCQFNPSNIADAIANSLKKYGFNPIIDELRKDYCDRIDIDKLSKI